MRWLTNARHLHRYGHLPLWISFDAFWVCERCIKPPSRPPMLRPLFHRWALDRVPVRA